jgi:hypothetical protein
MVTEQTVAKAVRLLEERRVDVTGPDTAYVRGDHGNYRVYADEFGLECTCRAKKNCSHVLAAMLMFRARDIAAEDSEAEEWEKTL